MKVSTAADENVPRSDTTAIKRTSFVANMTFDDCFFFSLSVSVVCDSRKYENVATFFMLGALLYDYETLSLFLSFYHLFISLWFGNCYTVLSTLFYLVM